MTNLITSIVSTILSAITPSLKSEIDSFVKQLYVKAKATTNNYDDFAIEFLAVILGVKLS